MTSDHLGAEPHEIRLEGGNTSVAVRVGFVGAPRFLGIDEQGRETLTFLPGEVATSAPWPARVWSDEVLREVGELLASYHHAVGFIDWDVAGPALPAWDLAFALWQWVPLHHPALSARLGAPAESRQPHRIRLLGDAYGRLDPAAVLGMVEPRIRASAQGLRDSAARQDPTAIRLCAEGHLDDMERTLVYLDERSPDLTAEMKQP